MKRFLLLWMSFILTTAQWAYAFQSGGLYYNITSSTEPYTVEVTYQSSWYSGDYNYMGLTSVTIPATVTYDGTTYSVTSIGEEAFYRCTGLTSITIPNSVTSIGSSAFYKCTGLTSVTIPESVTSIGDYAFSNCTGLTAITIPNSVTSIGSDAFSWCTGLTSITIPNSVTTIGSQAFYNCTGLTAITIPESVTSIGDGAFMDCTGLTAITIPNSVTSIGEYAFENCTGLTSVVWNAKQCVAGWSSSSDSPFYSARNSITSFTLGDEVESIPAYLCYAMSKLTSITIPESVTRIGSSAFSGCTGLTSIAIGNSVTSIGSDAFSGCTGLTSVTIPNSVTSIGSSAFYSCTGLTSIAVPESVTSIGYSAFSGCTGITSVVWNAKQCASGWSSSSASPFYDARNSITSFTFGNEVESIPVNLCYGMSMLTSITIPENVTNIENSAFSGCTGLTSVVWNAKQCLAGWSSSSDSPFYSARNSITSFTLGDEVESIPAYLCYAMSKLTSITIPESVTRIGSSAFSGCTGLTSITIPNSVTSIGSSAFSGCTGLTVITIPYASENILNGCSSLSTLVLNGNKACTSSLLYGSSSYDIRKQITSLTTTDDVTSIDSSAFSGCSNLETIELGANVQTIGDKAFSGCQNIYEIRVHASKVPNVAAETATSTTDGTFRGVSKLAELYVPSESVKKYKIHPVWGLFNMITAIPYVVTLHCDNVQGAVSGAGSYQANEQVRITASANEGYRFVQWSDGITTNPRTLVVASDTVLTAEFEAVAATEYTVSVSVVADQHGTVQMTLQAVPDAGYQFSQWSDGNTANPRTIVVNENMTLRAMFVLATNEVAVHTDDASSEGTHKIIRNGQVLILRDGKTYTTMGVEVE